MSVPSMFEKIEKSQEFVHGDQVQEMFPNLMLTLMASKTQAGSQFLGS